MGFIKNTSDEMKVYLTDWGRQKLLEQGFVPSSFTISDHDVNYLKSDIEAAEIVDLTGDYNDNVFSISKYLKITSYIIK